MIAKPHLFQSLHMTILKVSYGLKLERKGERFWQKKKSNYIKQTHKQSLHRKSGSNMDEE